jgi:glutaredoxin
MALMAMILASASISAQNRNIRIIEDQGKGVITLSCENLLETPCDVTLDITSTGLDLSKPNPITARVPAGKTVLLVTLTPQPGQAWSYRYNTQYTQIIPAQTPDPVQDNDNEIRPWDIPANPAPPPPPPPAESSEEIEEVATPPVREVLEPESHEPPARQTEPVPERMDDTRTETVPPARTSPPVEREQDVRPVDPSPVPPMYDTPPHRPSGKINKTPGITLYTTPDCLKCDQAKLYLEGQGVKFKEVDISYTTSEVKAMYAQLLEQGYGGPVVAPVVAHSVNMYFDVPDVRSLLRNLVYE